MRDFAEAHGHFVHRDHGFCDIAGDFPGRCRLLLHRRGDRSGDGVYLLHRADYGADLLDGQVCRGSYLADVAGNLIGGPRSLYSKLFDLGCHHGKPLAGRARPCCFNRGVEREQIGLSGDAGDDVGDGADQVHFFAQRLDGCTGGAATRDRLAHDRGGLIDLRRYLPDRRRQLFGRACDRLGRAKRLLRGQHRRLGRCLGAGRGQFHRASAIRHGLDVLSDDVHRRGCFVLHPVRHPAQGRGQCGRELSLLFPIGDPLGIDPCEIIGDGALHDGERTQQPGRFAASPGVDRIVQFSAGDRGRDRDAPANWAHDRGTEQEGNDRRADHR